MRQPGSLLITGGEISGFAESEFAGQSAVTIEDGVITAIDIDRRVDTPYGAELVEATGLLVVPGLIDIQINGGFGHDFTADAGSIWEVGAKLPNYGVTAFLPTVVTSDSSARRAMMAAITGGPPRGYRGAMPLGAHFEGPFISRTASGAHDPAFLRLPSQSDSDVDDWSPANGVRMVTLAPELDGALELVRSLVERGVVVSAGHSTANRDQAVAGFDAGITYATHLFNGMSPLSHRDPGLVGAALADWRVTVGLIADGIHVHPDVMKILAWAVGYRLSLVTDATAALGMPDGQYVLGGRDVILDASSVRLADDGRLAGSAITAIQALTTFQAATLCDAWRATHAMAETPSRLLSLWDRGEIRVGRRADLNLFTPQLELVATFIGGERWA